MKICSLITGSLNQGSYKRGFTVYAIATKKRRLLPINFPEQDGHMNVPSVD